MPLSCMLCNHLLNNEQKGAFAFFYRLDYTQLILDAFTFGIYGAIKTHQKIELNHQKIERPFIPSHRIKIQI